MDFRAILEAPLRYMSLVIFGICLSLDSQVLVNSSAHGNPATISRSDIIPSPIAGPLELAAESLERQAININQSALCLPVHVANERGVDIQMLHCSTKARSSTSSTHSGNRQFKSFSGYRPSGPFLAPNILVVG